MKHTPTPWEVRLLDQVYSKDNDQIADCMILGAGARPHSIDIANAEFIITACNNYYNFMELLNVAKSMLADAMDRDECYDEITDEMFDDFQALKDAIDKCEGR